MKKILCLALSALLILALMLSAGCNQKSPETDQSDKSKVSSEAGTTGETAGGEKLTIRVLANFSDASQSKAFTERLQAFMEQNPNIIIDDWSTGDETVFFDKFKTAVAQGDPPEVFVNYGGESQAEYAKNNIMADLTDILNEDKEWSDKLTKSLFNSWEFNGVEGVYAIPYAAFGVGIYYNKDLFAQINAQPPETIEDLLEVSAKFKEKGIIPLPLGDKETWRGGHLFTCLSMKKFGSQKTLDLCSRKAKWNDPDMVELFKLLKHMQDQGVFGDNIVTLDYNGEKSLFHTEKAAMHMDGTWYLGSANTAPIASKIGFVPFPYFKDKPEFKDSWMGGATGGFCLSGLAEGAKRDAAIKLLKFISSVEHFKYMWDKTNGGIVPPMKIEDLGIDSSSIPPITKSFLDAFAKGTDIRNEIETYDPMSQLVDKVRDEIQGLFAGTAPEKTADAIQSEVDNYEKNK